MIKLQCKDRQRDRQIKNYIYLVYKQNQVLVDQTFPIKNVCTQNIRYKNFIATKKFLKLDSLTPSSLASTFAPFEINNSMTSILPQLAASMRGVTPPQCCPPRSFTAAPCSSRYCTISRKSWLAASCRGIQPQ